MPPAWTWDELFTKFRALGGTVDNIEVRDGTYGFGLFPVDPSQPVLLHIPANMVIPCRHVHQQGDDLVVSPESGLAPEARDFFTQYQRMFSWGSHARTHVETFHRQFSELPDDIVQALATIGIQITRPLGKEWDPFELFKMTRSITYGNEAIFMPVVDLLNHARDAHGFDTTDGVRVAGLFSGEVLVHYGPADTLGRFLSQQFICDELAAFSLTISIPITSGGKTLMINRRICDKQAGNISMLPVIKYGEERIELSHVMLGNERMPRMPRTIFRKLFPDLPTEQSDELFQRILNTNITLLVELLEAIDSHDSDIAQQLRTVARLQLKGLARSYGVRD